MARTTSTAPLKGKRLIIDLPQAKVEVVTDGEEGVVAAQSGRTIRLGKTLLRRIRTVRWAEAPRTPAVYGSAHVSHTGDAIAIGAGSRANTGIDYSDDNDDGPRAVTGIAYPAARSEDYRVVITVHPDIRITVKAAADFQAPGISRDQINDKR